MGSHIAAGTVIPDDTFVAGGCVTAPGQVLESGFVWGGSPARPLTGFDEARRRSVHTTAVVYAEYARLLRHG
jgi:carbonic anhydrase/acetyltransferase-like protein (isoleucine patch superfamily)